MYINKDRKKKIKSIRNRDVSISKSLEILSISKSLIYFFKRVFLLYFFYYKKIHKNKKLKGKGEMFSKEEIFPLNDYY